MNKAANMKARILETAISLFSHYSFGKTSVDDIAREARISKGTVYYYFRNKEELFLSAVNRKAEEFFNILDERLQSCTCFEEKLTMYFRFPMSFIFTNMPILLEGMAHIPMSYQERLHEDKRIYQSKMSSVLLSVLNIGKEEGLINENVDFDRLVELINDWFMLSDVNYSCLDKERVVSRIERDHEMIIQLILYGIIKRS
jgi:AcrR family transcriptional regulator